MHVRVLRFTGLAVPLLLLGVAAALAQTPGEIGKLQQQPDKHGGMRAVTIRTNDSLGIAGFLLPGDRVDVLLKRTRGVSAGDKVAYVEVLLQNVRVLKVDQITEGEGQTKADKAVTIEVTAEDAARIALGMEIGTLAFALRTGAGNQYWCGMAVQACRLSTADGSAGVRLNRASPAGNAGCGTL